MSEQLKPCPVCVKPAIPKPDDATQASCSDGNCPVGRSWFSSWNVRPLEDAARNAALDEVLVEAQKLIVSPDQRLDRAHNSGVLALIATIQELKSK